MYVKIEWIFLKTLLTNNFMKKKSTKKTTKKVIKNEELINILKKFNPDESIKFKLTFSGKELVEKGYGRGVAKIEDEFGETFEYNYNLEYTTVWRTGSLESAENDYYVQDLINIFTKKDISECTSKDLRNCILIETQDGNSDYNVKWDGRINKSHKELLPDASELYWSMDISDSEYVFSSIENLEIYYQIDNNLTWIYNMSNTK